MKRIVLILTFLTAFVSLPNIGSDIQGMGRKDDTGPKTVHILKTLTVYNPTTKQCDNTPFITASNAKIDALKLAKQQLRWIALSRNLLKRWKGDFSYGDTVKIFAGDPAIDGLWIIQDNLNKRYRDRGDLLFDRKVRRHGIWKNVQISKV
ncbi:hypothetical protein BH10BAC4_BH10BAC4_19810 [soil metagenome]